MIIKTIHLMNFAKADTLAPIVKMRRSEKTRAWGVVCFHSNAATNLVDTPQLDNLPDINLSFARNMCRSCVNQRANQRCANQ
jgi:hypothetical protein